ncbi:MAG: IS1 family transposase [Steroidobacteraceae bacterium]
MNKLSIQKCAQILGRLVEGNSLRAKSRLADVSINTVTKLLVDVGTACSVYQDKALRNLPCKRIQIDEIWSFVYAKARNASMEKWAAGEAGDIWTWTAIDADTKLVPSWLVGNRTADAAMRFICDLKDRLEGRIQLTSDGLTFYPVAVEEAFGEAVDYSRLIKYHGPDPSKRGRYSPPIITGTERICCKGNPDQDHVSTSYVERQNLTMRMSMRRFTRLTNAFSMKVENHAHAVALHFMYYNFGRIHKTLRITPAMAAGVSDHIWSLEEIAKLAD